MAGTAGADAAPSPQRQTIVALQFNSADGKACDRTKYDCLAPIKRDIAAFNPDMVAIQEVCESDAAALVVGLGWTSEFGAQSTTDPACGGSDRRGNLITSPHPMKNLAVYPLPHTAGINSFNMACAIIEKPNGNFRGCSTHIIAGKDTRPKMDQIDRLVNITGDWRPNQKVLVGGDFNLSSPSSAAFASMRNAGFKQTHPSTNAAGAAVEYVWFYSPLGVTSLSTAVRAGGHSDHALLKSQASL